MREKIAEKDKIYNGVLNRISYLTSSNDFHGYRSEMWDALTIFEIQILSLLLQQGWTPPIDENDSEQVADVCSERFDKAMRAKGWFHKDDVTEVSVRERCPYCKEWPRVVKDEKGSFNKSEFFCQKECNPYPTLCHDTGFVSRPLTIGELLEKAKEMVELLKLWKRFLQEETPVKGDAMYQTVKDLIKRIGNVLNDGEMEEWESIDGIGKVTARAVFEAINREE